MLKSLKATSVVMVSELACRVATLLCKAWFLLVKLLLSDTKSAAIDYTCSKVVACCRELSRIEAISCCISENFLVSSEDRRVLSTVMR